MARSGAPSRRRAVAGLLALAVALALAPAARAHEIGAGRVDVLLRSDGSYRVELYLDPEATLLRLELAHGEAPTPGLGVAALQDRLMARRDELLSRLRVTADGAPQSPAFRYLETLPPRLGKIETTVRLEGRVTPGAALRVSWSLPVSRYALLSAARSV